ncbi:unknown protein (plasmid) [Synechocystis sp. PCC 6803]|jgi:hypothetical protein|uniref:Uncharacterized protein n=1 Tax=Synechocystis sp. (strain ATCC 27184 / PCC 6803 / Kazusa) TaxID=1111708 RepID=Q6ZEW5_SYNY3|nr:MULTISPECIES: hypothetical protein [unclassified Synechocystis]AGF53442.1 hypothetical protein MYO_2160 [Synechocystis sp. PCC 6803]AVP91571.1 hypothetical protein C7I86_17535 [Synechocystis sp. IPPAS B-1465]MBD2619995.1 hypothetical protein [Synechocystis sp. FACHB-898]MBD2640821.1 hypothetical protein [Synechocystis sp. FACHB-908]MBD2662745.1 hypothetical protein [Synechocystis sp. FACHB-929]
MSDFPKDWAMYEPDGDFAVSEMMREVKAALKNMPLPEVRTLLKAKIELVGISHGEIYDSEVRNKIESYLTSWACEVHELNDTWNTLSRSYWSL